MLLQPTRFHQYSEWIMMTSYYITTTHSYICILSFQSALIAQFIIISSSSWWITCKNTCGQHSMPSSAWPARTAGYLIESMNPANCFACKSEMLGFLWVDKRWEGGFRRYVDNSVNVWYNISISFWYNSMYYTKK